MDLQEVYARLNFWVNKTQGAFYTMPDLDRVVDEGQLGYYKDCFIKYGTSQRLNDALAPFKKKTPFTTSISGLLTVPDDYMDLISIEPIVNGIPAECPILNDDELTQRKKSQVIPMTTSRPFAEEVENWDYQLYPTVQQSGMLSYFRRPQAPKFVYSVISGRVIVYDANASTQLLWGDDEIAGLLVKTLNNIGINIGEADIINWSEQKDQQNLTTPIKI